MRTTRKQMAFHVPAVVTVLVLLWGADASAVPSFSRQTGLTCDTCHTTFPQLTAFGRRFKATGYTMTAVKEIQQSATGGATPLELTRVVPLSVMAQASFTTTNKAQPDTQNNDVQFPQQLSLFLAGAITDSVGSFLQVTYAPDGDHFSMDNTDIRFARSTSARGEELIYGITLNNNPTVEDLWNSTPAWGFPWATSDSAPTPAAQALLDGALAQDVAGLGAYALWGGKLYGLAAVYRSEHLGGDQPPDSTSEDTIRGVAPYWRLAWQQGVGEGTLEVGTYGLFARLDPEGVTGAADEYTDLGFDLQYERPLGADLLAVRSTYIYEHQDLEATHGAGNAENRTNHLHTFRLDATYNRAHWASLTLGYFSVRGGEDRLLYAPGAVDGSRNGSPDSDGFVAELGYYPWQNLRLSVQYTAYLQFNGSSDNYDGFGRDASDNNTLYWLAWFMW